jgi:hypothetical protein
LFSLDFLEHSKNCVFTGLVFLSYVWVAYEKLTQSTVGETLKNRGVNVALFANGRCVAQVFRHPLYGNHYNLCASTNSCRLSQKL